MILTLLAVSLNDQALTRPITARFDSSGGTIGRADHSTMALPDPERFISRKQAEIAFASNVFMIRNVGAANPITVAQRTLGAGETAPLRHGDEVRIGGYLLRAECHAGEGARAPGSDVAATVASGAFVTPGARAASPLAPQALPPRPFDPYALPRSKAMPAAPAPAAAPLAPLAPLASDNPFADLFGAAPAAPDGGAFAGLVPPGDAFAGLLPPADPTGAHGARGGASGAAASPASPVSDDPFAGLMPGPAGLDPALGHVASTHAAPAARLPDDFDPFAQHAPAAAAARRSAAIPDDFAAAPGPAAGASPADDPFADLFGGAVQGGVPSIDQAFGIGSSDAGGDALANFVAGTPAPGQPAGGGLSTDPLMLFGDEGAAPTPAPASDPLLDNFPAVHGAYTPPKVAPPPAHAHIPVTVVAQPPPPRPLPASPASPLAPRPAAARAAPQAARPTPPAPAALRSPAAPPVRAAAASAPVAAGRPPGAVPAGAPGAVRAGDTAALWHAFCEGAGVDLPLPPGEGEALMRHIGRIMRAAVDGTLQLMSVRASTKHEMRAAVTQIQSSNNNPLKFSPDAAAGIDQLLSPPQRGFLDGASAMDDAMLDLVGHSIGSVAGMRAAIEGMLQRFEPAALEGQLGTGSRLANLLPMNRKARLWELYLQHHKQIRDEAEEDFHTVFGRAFVAAYEQQVERLEQQRQRERRARR
jgi:FHA domain-containing protein